MHVDKSGRRFRFDYSGRSRKDLQAMSAGAEQPREETLDGSSWNPLRRGGFTAELGLWMLRDWKPYPHRVRSQRGIRSPVRISGFQWHTGHTNNWAKVRSAHCSCAKAAVVHTGRATNIHWNARTSGYAAFTVVYAFHTQTVRSSSRSTLDTTAAWRHSANARMLLWSEGTESWVLLYQRPARRIPGRLWCCWIFLKECHMDDIF